MVKNNFTIPVDWQEKNLGDFLSISKGRLPKKIYETAGVDSMPYLSIKYLNGNETKYAQKSDGVIAGKDDLLVIADGSGSGRMYRGYHGLVSSTFLKISTQLPNEVSNDYLEVLFSHFDFTNSSFRKGGAIPHFDFQRLKDVSILLPPVNEQKKIAEILGTVDKEIEKTDEIIKTTEKLKKGLMQELFTKGIGHAKFKKTKIGSVPEEWKIVELVELTTKIGDGLHGTPEYSGGSEFYFINGNNISERKINIYPGTKNISVEEYHLQKKDIDERSILLSINGTIGNIGFYNGEKVVLGKSVAYINCNNDLSKEFIAYQLETSRVMDYFTKGLTGTTIQNLSLATIRKTPLFLPEIEEQRKIVDVMSAIDKKISINKKLKEKLTLLKKGLMQDLLSGKVRVI